MVVRHLAEPRLVREQPLAARRPAGQQEQLAREPQPGEARSAGALRLRAESREDRVGVEDAALEVHLSCRHQHELPGKDQRLRVETHVPQRIEKLVGRELQGAHDLLVSLHPLADVRDEGEPPLRVGLVERAHVGGAPRSGHLGGREVLSHEPLASVSGSAPRGERGTLHDSRLLVRNKFRNRKPTFYRRRGFLPALRTAVSPAAPVSSRASRSSRAPAAFPRRGI